MEEFKIGDRVVIPGSESFYRLSYPKGYAIISDIPLIRLHKTVVLKFQNGQERRYLNTHVKKYDMYNSCFKCGRAPGDIIHNSSAKEYYHHTFVRKVHCADCGEEFAADCEHNHIIGTVNFEHQHDSQIKRLANAAYARSIAERLGDECNEAHPGLNKHTITLTGSPQKPKGHAITLTGSIKQISEEDIKRIADKFINTGELEYEPNFDITFRGCSLNLKGGNGMLKNSDSILNSELSEEQKLFAEVLDQNENLNMNDVRVQKALMKTTEFRKNLIEILKTDKETKTAKKLAGL